MRRSFHGGEMRLSFRVLVRLDHVTPVSVAESECAGEVAQRRTLGALERESHP